MLLYLSDRWWVCVLFFLAICGCTAKSVPPAENADPARPQVLSEAEPAQHEVTAALAPTELTPESPPYPTGVSLNWSFQDGTQWDAEYMGHQDGRFWLRRDDDQTVVELPITDLDESSQRAFNEPAWMLRLARNLLRILEEVSRPIDYYQAEHDVLLEETRIPIDTRVELTAIRADIGVKEIELLAAPEETWLPVAHELAKLKIEEERLGRREFADALAKAKARKLLFETVGVDEEIQRLRMTVELMENDLLTPDDVTRLNAVDRIKMREMPSGVRTAIDQAVALLEKHLKELPEYDQALHRISDLEQSLMTSRLRISRQRLDELQKQAGQTLDKLGITTRL